MKIAKRFFLILVIAACICSILPGVTAAGTPTYATLSTSKTSYASGETVIFNAASDGEYHRLTVSRADGKGSEIYYDVGNSYSLTLPDGRYKAFIESSIHTNAICSNAVLFDVGVSSITSPPQWANLSVGRVWCYVGETVVFNIGSDGNSRLHIYNPDGTTTSYDYLGGYIILTFSTPGRYQAALEAWNEYGSKMSSKKSFDIVEEFIEPTETTTTVPTTVITTTQSTTSATTQPTTQSTTVTMTTQPDSGIILPTTAIPSASTTAPTSAYIPSYEPTAVPTTQPSAATISIGTIPIDTAPDPSLHVSYSTTAFSEDSTKASSIIEPTDGSHTNYSENMGLPSDFWWCLILLLIVIAILLIIIVLLLVRRKKDDRRR